MAIQLTERSTRQRRSQQRYLGVFADVHANLPALEAVRTFFVQEGIHQCLFLGDCVGYGPHPAACVEYLAEWPNLIAIRGNHDHAAASGGWSVPVSALARWSLTWTLEHLGEAHQAWLRDLPVRMGVDGWLALHGAPLDPESFHGYVYDMTFERNLDCLAEWRLPLCFHGHTHIPRVYWQIGQGVGSEDGAVQLLSDYQHALVCPGSVGQPRNGDWRAHCGVYDQVTGQWRIVRLPYDRGRTLADMKALGFCEPLVKRLETAR